MEERRKCAGLKAFLRIMECWGLQEVESAKLLGLTQIPKVSEVTIDQLERISHTLAIYRALHTLLQDPNADEWAQKPNHAPLFNGRAALDLLKEGTEGFRKVRVYLEGQTEGSWHQPLENPSIAKSPTVEPVWQRHVRERSFPLDREDSNEPINVIRTKSFLKAVKIKASKKSSE